jgi:hypothetical protein
LGRFVTSERIEREREREEYGEEEEEACWKIWRR